MIYYKNTRGMYRYALENGRFQKLLNYGLLFNILDFVLCNFCNDVAFT